MEVGVSIVGPRSTLAVFFATLLPCEQSLHLVPWLHAARLSIQLQVLDKLSRLWVKVVAAAAVT